MLEKYGWVIECESPYELRHSDGSFATGQAANIVELHYRNKEIKNHARYDTVLNVVITTLEQIATTPRNKGARRNAIATLEFLRTQLLGVSNKKHITMKRELQRRLSDE